MVDVGDDDEPEAMDVDVDGERPAVPTPILEAEGCLDELRRCTKARNLPSDSTYLLERFSRRMRVRQASRPKSAPTLNQFFSAKNRRLD
jgi:hypothetical protein